MRQWEIRTYAFPGAGEHLAVIVSHPLRVERKETVEVLRCTTLRAVNNPGLVQQPLPLKSGCNTPDLIHVFNARFNANLGVVPLVHPDVEGESLGESHKRNSTWLEAVS